MTRRLAAGVVMSVGMGLLQPVVSAAVPVAVPDEAPTETLAQQYAKQGSKSVRVGSRLTETEEVLAQPDGSLVWRQHVRPVRTKKDGQWADVDTTLVRRAGGEVGPRVSTLDLALSGGGSTGPLVKVGHGAAEVGLTWDGVLPEPVLDGPSATYPEVWPGVDLKVTADTVGFSEALVVKNAEAAKNPKLGKVTFGTYTKNTAVRGAAGKGRARAADGTATGIEVVDGTGEVVFTGDATRMWDSSGRGSERDRQGGSAEGTRRGVMRNEVTPAGVTISPDAAFLSDKDTRFPVYLDPEYLCSNTSWCGMQHRVVVQSGFPGAHNFDGLDDLKAGYETLDRAGVSRSYIQMNTAPILGKRIHWANLNTTVIHSWKCEGDTSDTELWLAGGVDGGTTWGNQPNGVYWLSNSNVANCHDAGDVHSVFDAGRAVVDAANNGWGTTTFELKAADEGNVSGWRRFALNPYLEVAYDSVPNNPWGHAMQNGAVPCVKGDDRPWLDTRTPQVQALVSDPDGGSLSVEVATSGGPYGNDVPNSYRDNNGNRFEVGTPGPNQAALAQYWVPGDWITGDGIYKWAIRVGDGEVDSPRWDWDCEFYVDTVVPLPPKVALTGRAPQVQGDLVAFAISVPLATSGLDDIDRFVYTTDGSDPSVQGSPSVARNPGRDAGGNVTAALTATAVNGNQNLIRVKAVNKTGKPGPNATCVPGNGLDGPACAYTVLPLTPEKGLAGAWGVDDQGGLAASDNVAALRAGATAHPLALQGNAAWSLGYSGGNSWTQPDASGAKDGVKGGMFFPGGGNGYLSTSGPVLDTSQSFTMSAWAKLTDTSPNTWHAVISQDGSTSSGALIEYSSDANAWTFNLPDCDCTDPANSRVVSKAPPRLNVWTHLTGTYDAASGLATLYVDGVKQNSLVRRGWSATGPLTVGALKWNGNRASYFSGWVDDVQVWQRPLSLEDVRALVNTSVSRAQYGLAEGAADLLAVGSTGSRGQPDTFVPAPVPSLQGYWKLDESTGTTAADAGNNGSGYSPQPLTLTGGSTWVSGKSGNAVHFDGTGYGKTAGPVVDTSQSFTVSAWAKLDDLDGHYGVVGQSASGGVPGFLMRYSKDVNAWVFGLNSSPTEASGRQMKWTFLPNQGAKAGEWTLVTGVYNREAGQLQIYVNGRLAAQRKYTDAPWNAAGPLSIGSYDVGGMTHGFKGAVDQVQVWQRPLTASQVGALAGLSYVDATWSFTGPATVTPSGNVAEVATQGDTARAQFTWDGVVQAQRPDSLRTDRSFTVEAWVKQDAADDYTRIAVSADEAFSLDFRRDNLTEGHWSFGFACTRGSPCLSVVWSDAKAERNTWTHLAATYDSTTNAVCLYVNGVRQSTCVSGLSVADSTGDLRIGKFKWLGKMVNNWNGGVAGVRVYSGVRTDDQIRNDRSADDPGNLFGVKHYQ
ncbi:LamG-like jellyroll fold domain-containing protein [Actinocrispum wychmicini]|uniref:LamG-like jellyroll fold domain-containing protein n=1 Tax=Actinocrispum wychmicini TaxID=1213861 RepID=UPI0014044402|nr:LamG-like jellyroll fold domain-containing protein [Actinocrispum wychmicini]